MGTKRLTTPIYIYDDHIDYLREWYLYAKRFGLTQREFLGNAGIHANAFLSDVLSGRKKIGRRHIAGFVKALGLKGDEQDYFSLLVRKEKCRKPEDKREIFESLAKIRKQNITSVLPNRTLEYFASWRYPVIREYILCKGAVRSPKEIADALRNLRLSTHEITLALAKLLSWNMIAFDDAAGEYRAIGTGTIAYGAMPHPVVNDVKRTLIEASVHAMEETPRDQRHVSMAIRGISEKSYQELCMKIDSFRQEFLSLQEDREIVDRIVSLNIQVFPVMQVAHASDTGGKVQ
jgi:uncharacterized protein (TIGR02147 family)